MDVLVIMRLLPIPLEVVLVLMVRVVAVTVDVPLARVRVLMFVVLGQVQPDANTHQQCGEQQRWRRHVPKQKQ